MDELIIAHIRGPSAFYVSDLVQFRALRSLRRRVWALLVDFGFYKEVPTSVDSSGKVLATKWETDYSKNYFGGLDMKAVGSNFVVTVRLPAEHNSTFWQYAVNRGFAIIPLATYIQIQEINENRENQTS